MIDVVELGLLMLECIVIGMGMSFGDWFVKLIMIRWLNLTEVIPTDDEDDEDDKRKRRSRSRPSRHHIAEVP